MCLLSNAPCIYSAIFPFAWRNLMSTHNHLNLYLFLVSSTASLWLCISLRIFAISCWIKASSRCLCNAFCLSSFITICLAWSWASFWAWRCWSCCFFSCSLFSRFSLTYWCYMILVLVNAVLPLWNFRLCQFYTFVFKLWCPCAKYINFALEMAAWKRKVLFVLISKILLSQIAITVSQNRDIWA